MDPATLKQGDAASCHQVCFDRLQRYQVIKQADTLLAMTRLPDAFTPQEKQAAWQDFEPKCPHDSTLSFASHALFAAQNGLDDAAWRYFEKAAYLDLREVMGNTGKEGLHLACFGETWQAVVFGFAGLHFTAGGPALAPPTCLTAGRACISVSTGTAPRTAPMCAAIPPEGYRQASSSARNEQRQIFRKRADV